MNILIYSIISILNNFLVLMYMLRNREVGIMELPEKEKYKNYTRHEIKSVVNPDETDRALKDLREYENDEPTLEEIEFNRQVREEGEKILREKGLPNNAETVFWVDETVADKEPEDKDKPDFTILSWNIERGYKVDKQIEYLKKESPDVVCLQEVDWGCERTGDQNIALKMAAESGYKYVGYTTEFVEVDDKQKFPTQQRDNPRLGKGGGVHGQAFLSKYPIESDGVACLKLHKLWHDWERKSKSGEAEPRIGQRISQKIRVKIGNREVLLYNSHFEDKVGGETGRLAQFDQVADDAEKEDAPTIIVGDLNTLTHGLAGLMPGNRGDFFVKGAKRIGKSAADMWKDLEFSQSKTRENAEEGTLKTRDKEYRDPFESQDKTFEIFKVYKGKLDWTLFQEDKFDVLKKEIGPKGLSDHQPLLVDVKMK
ncbi:MAG: hypothetical protein GF349_01150 [Candidatus Magasanikbacteria bacterium]|nr:hypothetical protein [Candidatus Magasanikbacteria bacterium]